MEFHLIHENKLKVILTADDMESMNLDYDIMDYNDPATRKALLFILENGRGRTGFDPRRAKLFIEVYPCEGGGCVFYFTNLQPDSRRRGESGMTPVLFQFEDVDTLIDGAAGVYGKYGHRIYKSSLYLIRGVYRLIVLPLDYSDRLSVYFLSEYGERVGEGELPAAFTEEHGRELIRDNAIEVLSRLAAGAFGADLD